MHGTPKPRDNRQSDPQKSDTPDKYRNDKAQWKAPDQPDHTGTRGRRDPEKDYPGVHDGSKDR
ncbi:hypothetical protein [Pseudoxanthomonas wuyuanensis]|uniref:Uncharacterized protein n=1 Tax=Pseudoxanthomonas wuyuanensis TaxID=1073196 RepID=A0A286D318_9GAMM|nr:hypothetical protein [Pseudoxanthomonas wuyuanensis]KAF1723024.1 hypothetical protein CSC75_00605 [Pseudoxanthomonas wuyuanensis]SOD53051.1 hypothetical protein SAMN06296416_102213 [Pseudoxanthomonas wuyuanensis]